MNGLHLGALICARALLHTACQRDAGFCAAMLDRSVQQAFTRAEPSEMATDRHPAVTDAEMECPGNRKEGSEIGGAGGGSIVWDLRS